MQYPKILKQAVIDEGNGTPTYRADIDADHPLIVSIEDLRTGTYYVRVCRNKPEPEPEPISECVSTTDAFTEAPQCRPDTENLTENAQPTFAVRCFKSTAFKSGGFKPPHSERVPPPTIPIPSRNRSIKKYLATVGTGVP